MSLSTTLEVPPNAKQVQLVHTRFRSAYPCPVGLRFWRLQKRLESS